MNKTSIRRPFPSALKSPSRKGVQVRVLPSAPAVQKSPAIGRGKRRRHRESPLAMQSPLTGLKPFARRPTPRSGRGAKVSWFLLVPLALDVGLLAPIVIVPAHLRGRRGYR